MSLVLTQRMRIQAALIDLANAGTYYPVAYGDDQKPVGVNLDQNDPTHTPSVPPCSVQCNEIESQFGIDKEYGRGVILARKSWVFELIVAWQNVEVTLEYFEAALSLCPILAATADYEQVQLLLLNSIPSHPVQQQPSNGTEAKFTIRAVLGRN